MHYLITFGVLLVFIGLTFAFKKNEKINNSELTEKILALFFVAIFFARYYSYVEYPVNNIVGIANSPIGPINSWLTIISVGLAQTAFCVLALAPFFKSKFTKTLTKYFCLPVYIFATIMMPSVRTLLMGPKYPEFGFSAIMLAIENGFGLFICCYAWLKDFKFDKPDKNWYKIVVPLLFMILVSFPSYGLQVLIGRGRPSLIVDDFTIVHRIFLYMGFIIPVCIYFALRDKDYETKRFAMIFLSITLLISFCTRYKYTSFLKPWMWPLHLCNTN